MSQHSTPSPSPGHAVLATHDLRKVFRTESVETIALAGINLSIDPGEYVAVTGPSGCGKTTLMSILGLLDDPSSGTYLLSGTSVAGLSESARAKLRNQHIGYVFQSFNLIDDLSVLANVELPLLYRGGVRPTERRERAEAMLDAVGISHRRQHYPSQLSGGQQQRVAIARSLVTEPAILLADEPTGNLDSKAGEAVMQLLEDLNIRLGSTILMVTHDLHYASRAKRIVRLADGQVVDEHFAADGHVLELKETKLSKGFEVQWNDNVR